MTLTTCIFTNVVVGVDYVSCREKWKHWYRSREGEKGGGIILGTLQLPFEKSTLSCPIRAD